jgi:hypothetical protein
MEDLMRQRFSDLHCHPSLYPYNRMRNLAAEHSEGFHLWAEMDQDLEKMERGARAASYPQCDPPKMTRANARLAFCSITPIEKGFFGVTEGRGFGAEALRLLSGVTAASSALKLVTESPRAAAQELAGILRAPGPVRAAVQRQVMKYGHARLRHFLSDQLDYWDEFQRELDFLRRRDGVASQGTLRRLVDGQEQAEPVQGRYHLVRDAAHLRQIAEGDADEVAFVLNIEGAHTFTIGPDQERVPDHVIFERIAALKALPTPILFVGLAHHFDNGICGHAHSILDIGELLMDQRRRMGLGFERERDIGMRTTRALLDLDEGLRDLGGKRILIDAKHLSARSRREFYDEIINPYNKMWEQRPAEEQARYPRLPVFFSHAAYSGVASLDELLAHEPQENDHWHAPPYYAWSINCCDEDVRMIWQTGGLFGLCFDQRIAGVGPGQKIDPWHWPRVVMNQIFGFVDVIMLDDRLSAQEKRRAWDCVCLGTDYDGFIDPLSAYPTALSLPALAQDLRRHLETSRHTRQIAEIGVDALVDKICWKNAYDFALRHLPAACGQTG